MKKLISFYLILFTTHVYAYFDPGIGSMLGQFFFAALATTSIYIKQVISFVKSLRNKIKYTVFKKKMQRNLQRIGKT